MSKRYSCRLTEPTQAHAALTKIVWPLVKALLTAGQPLALDVRNETRSTEQNRILWARLTDVSKQVNWHGRRLSAEDWKHVFTASASKLDVVPNIEGTGFVALGKSTSDMTKTEFSALLDLILAFGDERDVEWSPTSLGREWNE